MATTTRRRKTHYTAEQRRQYREERAAKIQALTADIPAKVEQLTTSEGWLTWLRVASKFHHYSLNNQILIWQQCEKRGIVPTLVAGFKRWNDLGRHVRQGQNGIAILAPVKIRTEKPAEATEQEAEERQEPNRPWIVVGFKLEYVWDVSQTDGDPLPTPPEAKPLTGDADPELVSKITGMIRAAGYTVEYGTPHGDAMGTTSGSTRTVIVRDSLDPAHQVKTLVHELTHILLGHVGNPAYATHRGVFEVQAESVAYVVLGALGYDTSGYTIPYVAGWAGGDLETVYAAADDVRRVAEQIVEEVAPGLRPSFA